MTWTLAAFEIGKTCARLELTGLHGTKWTFIPGLTACMSCTTSNTTEGVVSMLNDANDVSPDVSS